jgi:L-ectoine synthase
MIVRNHRECSGNGTEIECPKGAFQSRRLLLKKDGMGYSLHRTLVRKGGPYRWHYKNHLESCYCISGSGRLTKESTGECWEIREGDIYALNDSEAHTFEAYSEVILLCIFNPPVTGSEVHQEDGSYAKED